MSMTDYDTYDCIVIGSGHAGSCAALAARQAGCTRLLMLEKAPQSWAGGNGYFTAGAFRTAHSGLRNLLPLVRNVTPELAARIEMEAYTIQDFKRDITRLCEGKSDPALVGALVESSRETIEWLACDAGVPFVLSFNRQAYNVGGRFRFWGGMVLAVQDGGKGLIAAHQRALAKWGVEVWYDTPMLNLLMDERGAISGVTIRRNGEEAQLRTRAVILASGGFESSTERRVNYLGPEWAHAKVRGTPYNTGEALESAVTLGAARSGDWSPSGCHSTCWDASASPASGSRQLSNQYTKSGYPLGLMLNAHGKRFVDEGADFRNYTYARFGRAILAQPGGVAWQVFDQRVAGWLREEEYADEVVRKVVAGSLEELVRKLVPEGLEDPEAFMKTMEEYNTAVYAFQAMHPTRRWDPSVLDGVSTEISERTPAPASSANTNADEDSPSIYLAHSPSSPSPHPSIKLSISSDTGAIPGSIESAVDPPKSNWALPLDAPPFVAVKVACGITFTFGGLAIDPLTTGVLRASHPVSQDVAESAQESPAHLASGKELPSSPSSSVDGLRYAETATVSSMPQSTQTAPSPHLAPGPSSPVSTCSMPRTDPSETPTHIAPLPSISPSPEHAPNVIPGLFCAGEAVGGLFYHNYPGGSGLTAGAVFGRRAGRAAAALAANAAS